jgi:hypothetical protein
VMLFINHSCDPNVGFAGDIVLVAMRDIRQGEELTADYALFDDYEGSRAVPRLLLLGPPAPHPGTLTTGHVSHFRELCA